MNLGRMNFKDLRDWTIDINSFECNASSMIDSIYIGPQGELLEIVDSINAKYGMKLAVTKYFTLKPGGYDSIKKAYSNWVLRWDMRPRGIKSIFDRIGNYGWRYNSFKQDILNLEQKMLRLRSTGMIWQDNTNDFGLEIDKLKSNINNSLSTCKELYPNIDISVKIIPSRSVRSTINRSDRYVGRISFPSIEEIESPEDYMMIFYIYIKKPILTTHILKSSGEIDTYDIPCDDILVSTGTFLLPLISRNWGRNTPRVDSAPCSTYTFFINAIYLSKMRLNIHPYIGTSFDGYTWDLDSYLGHSTNVCLGNMQNEIRNTLLNLQIEAHITYIVTWLTNYYVPQTNPLNRVNQLKKFGENRLLSKFSRSANSAAFDTFANSIEPEDCTLPIALSSSIRNHSRGKTNDRYGSSFRYDVSHDEYKQRLEEYIIHIKEDDLPCNECMHTGSCSIETNIRLFFQEKKYTPMEEGYIGYFIEIAMYRSVIKRRSFEMFVEEAVRHSNYFDPDGYYELILMSNNCCRRWAEANGEQLSTSLNWSADIYLDRLRLLMTKSRDELIALEEMALNPESTFVWTMSRIDQFAVSDIYTAKLKAKLEQQNRELLELNGMEEVIDEFLLVEETVTPEEATLRWASQQGGANNL